MAIDRARGPVLGNVTGAIGTGNKVALRCVYQVTQAVQVPSSVWAGVVLQGCLEFIMAGAPGRWTGAGFWWTRSFEKIWQISTSTVVKKASLPYPASSGLRGKNGSQKNPSPTSLGLKSGGGFTHGFRGSKPRRSHCLLLRNENRLLPV